MNKKIIINNVEFRVSNYQSPFHQSPFTISVILEPNVFNIFRFYKFFYELFKVDSLVDLVEQINRIDGIGSAKYFPSFDSLEDIDIFTNYINKNLLRNRIILKRNQIKNLKNN